MRYKRKKKEVTNIAKLESLKQINLNAAGVDVGAAELFVCVPEDRAEKPVRVFNSFTSDLYQIVVWLKECGVTTVAMESTGIYWIPLYEILEDHGFEVYLVNAGQVKNVPGRKSDEKVRSGPASGGVRIGRSTWHLQTLLGRFSGVVQCS